MGPHRETSLHEDSLVHEWRVAQLKRLGIPELLAEAEADKVDWHQIARLVQRGCSRQLALRIVRQPWACTGSALPFVPPCPQLGLSGSIAPVHAATPPRPAAPRRRAAADLLIPDTRRASPHVQVVCHGADGWPATSRNSRETVPAVRADRSLRRIRALPACCSALTDG